MICSFGTEAPWAAGAEGLDLLLRGLLEEADPCSVKPGRGGNTRFGAMTAVACGPVEGGVWLGGGGGGAALVAGWLGVAAAVGAELTL